MKKFIILPILLAISLLSACLFEINADVTQPISFAIPVLSLPLLSGTGTNLVVETGISNQGAGVMGDFANINEVRLNWTLSNNAANSITIAIGLTASSTVTNDGTQFTNFVSYHADSDYTAWIVPLMTLTQGQVASATYISGSVAPLLRNLLVISNSYQFVIQTVVTNPTAGPLTQDIDLVFGANMGMTIERATQEVPGIVSLFQ